MENSYQAAPTERYGPLGWWYNLTAPKPTKGESLEEREIARRGRLTSATLLIVILLLVAAYPVAFLGPQANRPLAIVLLIPLTIDIIALILNRAGRISAAGVLVVVGIEVGIGLSIVGPAANGGLTTYVLPQFDLLVQADFVAVSLLRPRSVIWLASWHILASILAITFLPHAPEFALTLKANSYEIYLRLITLQIIVAVVTYLWVTGAQQAIYRADRAEEIASLERREIELQQEQIEQKERLDAEIQQILQTHVRVANGDFSARAPLGKENVLWQIAYSLNNLLARLQSYGQMAIHYQKLQNENHRLHNALQDNSAAASELLRTREAAARLIDLLKQTKDGQKTPPALKSGTIIDAVATQLGISTPSSPTTEQGRIAQQRPRDHAFPRFIRDETNSKSL